MRKLYEEQLKKLHENLVRMGKECEEAIGVVTNALMESSDDERENINRLERQIDISQREIEQQCARFLMLEQPMATDLRHITAAQGMVVDMERIGDQCADIAEMSVFVKGCHIKNDVHISDMANATAKMVSDAIESFVDQNLIQAKNVIEYDDVVDGLFLKIRTELIKRVFFICQHPCSKVPNHLGTSFHHISIVQNKTILT